jgi:hypothetical protein
MSSSLLLLDVGCWRSGGLGQLKASRDLTLDVKLLDDSLCERRYVPVCLLLTPVPLNVQIVSDVMVVYGVPNTQQVKVNPGSGPKDKSHMLG